MARKKVPDRINMSKSLTFLSAFFLSVASTGLLVPLPDSAEFTEGVPVVEDLAPIEYLEEEKEVADADDVVSSLSNEFRCTVYYTPKESGFTAEAGFEMAMETRPGLNGRKFLRDFLLAVQKEGYGMIKTPLD
ncbi:MAG: hypothetical protein ABIY47_10210, partial [Opitutaceae bacterium]